MLTSDRINPDFAVAEDLRAGSREFLEDCLAGLGARPKTLPCKWFYDAEGSRLYELICELPEYYQPRVEAGLLERAALDIAGTVAPGTALVEYGSGASLKTRILLDHVAAIARYVPVDICAEELASSCASIRTAYPLLSVRAIHGDFTKPLQLDPETASRPLLGFFPGSTLGNFSPSEAIKFLRAARQMLGEEAQFLIGVDLRKDAETLIAAYDDAQGVTAAFDLNLLARINRELGGTFELSRFSHRALWNDAESRIEMHLVSNGAQQVRVGGRCFDFTNGESIHTENCRKFTLEGMTDLAAASGWQIGAEWVSDDPAFALLMLA